MAQLTSSQEPRYRVVCHEIRGEGERVVMDATGDGFVATTGVISAGRLRGDLGSAGPAELQAHLALRVVNDEQLAAYIAGAD